MADADAASVKTAETSESTHSSILGAKAAKLKEKLKSKLHHGHRDGSAEGDEYFDDDEDDDDLTGTSAGNGTEAFTPGGTKTAAQMYAEKHALDNGAVVAGSRTVDGNGQVVVSTATVRGPDGSIRTVPSAPGTPQNPPTPGKAASTRSHSGSTSLPATQSNWQRRAEFHNLFEGQVDDEEHLVSDYTCAWAKDILRHGRIYVGAQHVAFICTIIGLKCNVVIAYTDIVAVEKTVTARVIPNAISITTQQGDNLTFCSFVYRDTSYDLIVDCWKGVNSSAYNEFMSDQTVEAQTDIDAGTKESPFPNETSQAVTEHTAHAATDCTGDHLKETVLDVRFPSEPEKIFNLLFHDNAFSESLFADQKLTNVKMNEWQPAAKAGMKKREISYTKPLSGSVGPSSTTCHITDEELVKDPETSFEMLSITKTPDVPSGGSFEVQTKTCLTWAGGSKGGVRMVVTTDCIWSGRSMIKGIVTSASIAGQRSYNKDLAKHIRKHIQAHPAEFGSGDVNAPEADDEIGTEATAGEVGKSEQPPPTDPLGMIGSMFSGSHMAVGFLVVANLALLLVVLLMLIFGGRGKTVKLPPRQTLSEQAEVEALQRLRQLEMSWAEFRKAVDVLSSASTGTNRRTT